eukprot:UN02549
MLKPDKETGRNFYKCKGLTNRCMVDMCALLCEVDLWKDWVPCCEKGVHLNPEGDIAKFTEFSAKLPFPFTNRNCIMEGIPFYREEENAMYITSVTPLNVHERISNPAVPKSQTPKGYVRYEVWGGLRLRFIDPKTIP